ncbi:hypothetical protein IMZ48_19680 [Candidatus Bathyarchaeota archaeon]|nr:hypothetical protein [Candidatus Bathyarchaeota archaeon]
MRPWIRDLSRGVVQPHEGGPFHRLRDGNAVEPNDGGGIEVAGATGDDGVLPFPGTGAWLVLFPCPPSSHDKIIGLGGGGRRLGQPGAEYELPAVDSGVFSGVFVGSGTGTCASGRGTARCLVAGGYGGGRLGELKYMHATPMYS